MNLKTIFLKHTRVMLLLLFLAGIPSGLHAQNVDIHVKDVSIKEVLKIITAQTGHNFIYSSVLEDLDKHITLHHQSGNEPIKVILDKIFANTNILYMVKEKQIVLHNSELKKKSESAKEDAAKKINGQVVDGDGLPLPGALIHVKGNKSIYTLADDAGHFSLKIPGTDTAEQLVISFIGMQQLETQPRADMLITLEPEAKFLDEVYVTGFQTISKERATGSFAKVTSEELDKKPVLDISNALIGMVPGLVSLSGSADARNNRFVIRGKGTFQGQEDTDPLIVVDNFPIQGFSSGMNPFETINPDDVENITVLKDAAATSIYGARAANGVIVITTKKGKNNEKMRINVDAFVSVSQKADLDYAFNFAGVNSTIDYLGRLEQYASIYNNSEYNPYYREYNPVVFMPKLQELMYEYKRMGNITAEEYNRKLAVLQANEGAWMDDYNKHIYRNIITQKYNISMSGGSERNKYNLSLSYSNERGQLAGESGDRVILNFSNTYDITKKLSFSAGISTGLHYRNNSGISSSELSNITTPYSRLFNEDGSYAHFPSYSTVYEPILVDKYEGRTPASWRYNPLEDSKYMKFSNESFNLRVQSSLDYKIIKGLTLSVKGQYEKSSNKSEKKYLQDSFRIRNYMNYYSEPNTGTDTYKTNFPVGGQYSLTGSKYQSYSVRGQLDYSKVFAEKHNLSAFLGGEVMSSQVDGDPAYSVYGYNEKTNSVLTTPDYINYTKNIYGQSVKFPFPGFGTLNTFVDRYVAGYLNIAYTYDRRYTLSGSARFDSSNYISDNLRNKLSPFWHVGLSWNLKNEKFMSRAGFLDFLTLKATFGTAGLAAGKKSVSTLTTVGSQVANPIYTNNEPYYSISLKGNTGLTWEKSRTFNIGSSFAMFRGKLNGSVEYYNRYSYDVLAPATVPYISQSSSSMIYNNAEILNKGVELSLGSDIQISRRISWNGNFNFSYNRNIVKEYKAAAITPGGAYVKGFPLSPLWGQLLVGYTPEGLPVLEGKDGQQVIVKDQASSHINDKLAPGESTADNNWLRFYGTTVAPYNIGFSNTFNIFDFTVSFMITGQFGHYFRLNNSITDIPNQAGYSRYIEDALAKDREGYAGAYTTMPVYNEHNKDMLNANNLYSVLTTLHNRSESQIRSANHIRLNDIYIGYKLPAKIVNKSFIRGLNIYMNMRNIGIIWAQNKEGIDPVSQPGSIKPPLSWTFGLKASF